MADTVTIVGKGPSANAASDHLCGDVAVINDAMKLIEGRVDYCFSTDIEMIEASRSEWHRVGLFVLPSSLHENGRRSESKPPDGFPEHRCQRYPYLLRPTAGSAFVDAVNRSEVVLFSGATAAMSWLAYSGYRHIRLIGFDGGTEHASGVKPGIRPGIDFDRYIVAQSVLLHILRRTMGVEFTWISAP